MSDNLPDPGTPQGAARTAPPPTIGTLLRSGVRELSAGRHGSGRLEAELLLANALGRSRSHLFTWPDEPVMPEAQERYRCLLQRAVAGEPLAYLVGEREFWSLPLSVSPAVLIPRPETELLVERCLARGPAPDQPGCHVCDLGTGSGAIALALASERPAWQLLATDRCEAALQLASANAARLGLANVRFVRGDWFLPLAAERFDLLVSNPPYVAAGDPALAALRHEPLDALTPGPTGLEALTALIAGAPSHLRSGGWLILEHGADQAQAVAQRLQTTGYARIGSHRDPAGHARVTEGFWP